ncbi:MAG TPA: hypothetical protein VFR09_08005, partial [Alphaproteobacteria bacterium]|nr:hypothetical protein [Alphaproteobacteria bacterium]
MTIPILHPGDAMPKGIAFCSSVAEGVGHVISGSLECALWRPSNTEDIRKEASLVAIPHIRPQGSKDETGRAVTAIPLRGGDVSSACPLVAGLFDEIAEGLTQYYPNEYFRFSPTFRCYVEGFSDCV